MNRRVNYTSSKKVSSSKATATKPAGNKSGAKVSESSQSSMTQAWLIHHRLSCLDSLMRLLRAPWQSLLTWLVVAIAIVLPATLYLGLSNVQQLGQGWQGSVTLSAFIRYEAKPLAVEQLQQRLSLLPEIDNVSLVTPEEAREEFQEHSGLGRILESLEVNPLPAVLIIEPAITQREPSQLQQLEVLISGEPLVDSVQLDLEWLKRLYEMMAFAQRVLVAFAALLALGVLLIIGNTIRLEIENRREEIVVVKMVGGTDSFVRCPFLYTGFWYGAGGGCIALLILLFAGSWLSTPVERLLALYRSDYSLTWVDPTISMFMIGGAGLLGWLGAWLAVNRHLKHIEPV